MDASIADALNVGIPSAFPQNCRMTCFCFGGCRNRIAVAPYLQVPEGPGCSITCTNTSLFTPVRPPISSSSPFPYLFCYVQTIVACPLHGHSIHYTLRHDPSQGACQNRGQLEQGYSCNLPAPKQAIVLERHF
jgi:hypothetical protein